VSGRGLVGRLLRAPLRIRRARAPASLGYVLKCFPRISETFILNEILQLERLGMHLVVYSMIRPTERKRHALVAAVRSRVVYLPWPLLPAAAPLLGAHLSVLLRHPWRYLAAAAEALRSLDSDLIERFVQAGALAARLNRDGVRHLHAGFVHAPGSVAWLAHRLTGVSFSLATHAKDLYHSRPGLLARKLAATSLVLTCTRYNLPHLRRMATESGIRRLVHVYHGTDLRRFRYGPCRLDRSPVVLAVARLVEKKGLDDLVRACRILVDRGQSLRCVIVGEGARRRRLEQLVEELRLRGVVELAGALPQEQVIGWYRRAAVLALPCFIPDDGDRAGIPNVLVEAMASGLPVVSTPVSGIPELIEDGRTGLLVPPRDAAALASALERLLSDPGLGESLRRAARASVEGRFDLARNARTIARELRAAMGEAPAPRPAPGRDAAEPLPMELARS
jgi:glycosyltransferase involved in cell wall biosynthesis